MEIFDRVYIPISYFVYSSLFFVSALFEDDNTPAIISEHNQNP